MKKHSFDITLILGLFIAHFLMLFSFEEKSIFWYIFSGSLLSLILYVKLLDDDDKKDSFINYIALGSISGFALYVVFWAGLQTLHFFHLPVFQSVKNLYRSYAPTFFWQYLALLLIAAPGEEIFWRGFVQKRLTRYMGTLGSIITAALLYSLVQFYSGAFMLVFAAFLSGLVWGFLYSWKKSIPLVIVSHLIFDLMLFIILPLK
jgi:membrane protease YdiL (CAAX protease family)